VDKALKIKQNPLGNSLMGKNKTLGLLFLNPSLRTRLSTQKAAMNLGMNTLVMNIDKEGWALEFEDGVVMNGNSVEHVKDAAAVIGLYCDVVGIRCFPTLKNREEDYAETVLHKFIEYCHVPIISLESATLHPLQSFADLITIRETWNKPTKPKVVLTWAPHIKPLPQAVPNSFAEWMCKAEVDFTITHPPGFELKQSFTQGAQVIHNRQEALENADYVYVKNWSSYENYGAVLPAATNWLLSEELFKIAPNARIMHCMPVRRNLELSDTLIDGSHSLLLKQAENRVYAAQAVLTELMLGNDTVH
jgi:N-succinyl-L-ornithine transcarbamylase